MKYHLYELLMRFLIDGLIDDTSSQRPKELRKHDLKKFELKREPKIVFCNLLFRLPQLKTVKTGTK